MAACLWAGDGSAASHGSAAALWGFPGYREPESVEVSTNGSRRPKSLPVVVHRVDSHLLSEIQSVDGIPTTSVRRTLLDLCGARDRRAERALDHALLKEMTSLGRLWLLYDESWTQGRRGIAVLRAHLAERTVGRGPSDGELARLMWGIVRDFGLPTPSTEFRVDLQGYSIHADFAYPHARLLIELDGYAYHMDRAAFEKDRERDNDLQAIGWRVLRFTWAKLRFDSRYVAHAIGLHLPSPSTEWAYGTK